MENTQHPGEEQLAPTAAALPEAVQPEPAQISESAADTNVMVEPAVAHTCATQQQAAEQTVAEPFVAGNAPAAELPPRRERRNKNQRGKAIYAAVLAGSVLFAAGGGVFLGKQLESKDSVNSAALQLGNLKTATSVSAIAAAATPSVVTLDVQGKNVGGSGSGVVYSQDGYIITNAHVVAVDGTTRVRIRVRLSDGTLLRGKLVGIDPYADLAVVKVERDGLTPVTLANSNRLNVGDLTVAIGAPLELPSTVTSGVISAVNRGISVSNSLQRDPRQQGPQLPWLFDRQEQDQQNPRQQSAQSQVTLPVLQTDASINPGNSGGALLNGRGQLIGINVAIASATGDKNSAGSVGLGFAIPSNLVKRVVDDLIVGKEPSHGLLGANVNDATRDRRASHAGGLIVSVVKNSAAEKAGLQAGDIVTAVNGISAADGTSVSALVRMHEAGSLVKIDYIRDGKRQQTEVKLGALK